MVSSGEIKQLALDIENEMYKFYSGLNERYKNKYHSLLAEIKDPNNKTLFRKILNAEVTPAGLFLEPDFKFSNEKERVCYIFTISIFVFLSYFTYC